METTATQRRLAAVLAADVVGFSRLMGADEEGTLSRIRALRRDIIEPGVQKHQGRIVKTTGDGFLIEFQSPVEAVRCALAIQGALTSSEAAQEPSTALQMRIGINLGDILIEPDGDIYGDGVNVAARLEQFAEPGAVMVSGGVYEVVRDKVAVEFADRGEQTVKNIARPVRVYAAGAKKQATTDTKRLRLPDKPSIAVLPFTNMSGDPEQDYFADGVVDEIITALSHFGWLFVIARNSSFTYKGRATDIKQVGRELGVRYVLEGSIRRSGSRIRINAQLADCVSSHHIWDERFDAAIDDIFALQDEVASAVAGRLGRKLEHFEIERSSRKPTDDLDAYDYYLRGIAALLRYSEAATHEALDWFKKAVQIDPGFAAAFGFAAHCYTNLKQSGWSKGQALEVAEAERFARQAVVLGCDDAVALAWGGLCLAFVVGEVETGALYIDRALTLNPNMARAWSASGYVRIFLGQPDVSIDHFARAMRLSPLDPSSRQFWAGTALAHFLAGRPQEAYVISERVLREAPDFKPSLRMAAASGALSGRHEEARKAASRLQSIDPEFSIPHARDTLPFRQPVDLERYLHGLRLAGLPE